MSKQTVNKSVSFEPGFLWRAKERAEQQGFKHSFSAWITKLIREDFERDPEKPTKPKRK